MSEAGNVQGNGGDLLVSLLKHFSIDAAFGVVSVHNLPLVDALERRLRWVPTRGEAGAVGAADGYARASGRPGCAVTSTGTGAGNAAGGLIEALTAATPLLHMTGQIEREHLGLGKGVIHETRDQLGMLRSTSVWATTVGVTPGDDLSRALAQTLSHPRGPASLEWPIDGQFAPAEPVDWATTEAAVAIEPGAPSGDMDRAVELLANAKRPLLWVGGGGLGSAIEIDQMLDRLGAGLLTSNAGRGVVAETDQRVIGNFGSSAVGAQLLEEADLLLSVGTHFRSNETRSYKLGLPSAHIQIDIDPDALGRAFPVDIGLCGDAATVLSAVLAGLGQGATNADPQWISAVTDARQQARDQLRTDIGPYAPIADAMTESLGDDGIRVRDITIPNSAWGNRLLGINQPHTNICPRGGGIGQALGLGIGASVAKPDVPTMVLMGDGGLQVQVGEMSTIAQEQLPVVLVVFDDGGYGVLRNMQDQHLGRRSGVDLFTPSMSDLASAHDFAYQSVTNSHEFQPAFDKAIALGRPAMVHIDCDQLGPMPKPFTPPVEIP